MEQKNRSVYSAGILVLLAVLFVTLTILSSAFLKGIRLDLTENGLYTLSDGTRNILDDMDEPVTLYLYFSEDVSRDLPQFRSYARWAGEMLEEFVDHSGGKLTLKQVTGTLFTTGRRGGCVWFTGCAGRRCRGFAVFWPHWHKFARRFADDAIPATGKREVS